MIEQMSELITTLAQFIYILWPLFIITTFAYSFQGLNGKRWLKNLGLRVQNNLLYTWVGLFLVWIVTLFAAGPTPSLIPEPYNSAIFFIGLVLLLAIEINRLRLFPLRILARIDLHDARAVEDLRRMNPAHFEELVAETYRALGHQAVRTGQSGDHGIDVDVFTSSGEHWIVQCKRYRDSVGEGIVRELYGTLISEKADRAILVTSAEITPPAEAWARGKPIVLIDGWQFLKLVEKARKKAEGTVFDRLVAWFQQRQKARQVPNGLRAQPALETGNSIGEITRPIRANSYKPSGAVLPPLCPRCGTRMIVHPRYPHRNLYRCSNYPGCRVVVEKN